MRTQHFKLILKRIGSYNLIAYIFFIAFGIMTFFDAYARILISDPAYYLFNIINKSGFLIPDGRYTAVINQSLVVFAVKLKLPLDYLIQIYSVSFFIIRLFYFFIVNNVFKNRSAGLAIIAISVLGVAESYYRPTSESTIALLNSILLYAFLTYTHNKKGGIWKFVIQFTGALLLVLFGYYTHPIALFSLLFVVIYYILINNTFKSVIPYLVIGFTLTLFLWKVFVGTNSDHHDSLYGNLIASPVTIFNEITSYYPYKFFVHSYAKLYKPLFIMFAVGVFMLFAHKSKRLTGLVSALYILGYFVIVCTSFKRGDANMQMEKIFLPMVMFSALLFSDGVCLLRNNKIPVHSIAVVLIAFLGFQNISRVRPLYQGRIDYLKQIVLSADKQENRKLIINSEQLDRKIVFTWAMGIETLMLSSIDKEMEPLTVYCIQNQEKLEGKKDNPNNFIVSHFRTSYDYAQFNKHYFSLPGQNYEYWPADLKFKNP